MNEIVNYFENIPTLHRSLLLMGGISFFWFIEGFFPLFKFSYKKWLHALPNFFFTITTIIINFSMAFLLLSTSDWAVKNNFGILAFDSHFPSYVVSMKDLEEYDGVNGKYTEGIKQEQLGFCADNEDAVSMALTALSRLMKNNNLSYNDIGRLEVGTESQTDRSKSIKTNLMQLFKDSGNYDVEGTDTYNACYGGTNAFLNTLNWLQSKEWNGNYE